VSTLVLVLFFVIVGLAVVLAAMRSGRGGPLFNPQKRGGRRAVGWLTALAVLVFGVAIPIAVAVGVNTASKAGPVELNAQEEAGREIFNKNCVQCHTLGASQSEQTVGPDLDVLRPPKELTLDAIEKGRARGQGQMPAQLVTGEEAEAVAAYVAKVAGRVDN
jgi:mono/diheme cytochrome c family protein